jgi:hypothetical protein
MIILGKLWVWTKNSESLMRENEISRNNKSDIIMDCLYGSCTRPETMNNTCRKTVHRETMDRGFTVHPSLFC